MVDAHQIDIGPPADRRFFNTTRSERCPGSLQKADAGTVITHLPTWPLQHESNFPQPFETSVLNDCLVESIKRLFQCQAMSISKNG